MTGNTQDEPIQAQHVASEEDQVAGILLQQEADLAGHDEDRIVDALRQRLADGGHQMNDAELREHARRIAALEPNKFSKE